jgi:predicted nucleotidyltransferase component of viral defense system
MPEPVKLNLHEDITLFIEAVNFTASRTGFNPRLIEKDYFCTVLLAYLADHGGDRLVFKGGTCLAKVYADFYRLSEDLDFTIPLPVDANRTQRRHAVSAVRDAVGALADRLGGFTLVRPLTGANNSTQYNGTVEYESPTTSQPESILIEVSIREPLLMEPNSAKTRTLLLDPIGGRAMTPDTTTNCIAMEEAMAEKFRAAMSRRDAAIRDFYDLDYAVSHLGLDPTDPHLVEMVRRKLNVPGNSPVDVGAQRLADLKRQLNTRLRTVLRDKEFQAFDLDRAFGLITAMAERLI